jgi:hypothetical protein
MTDREFRDLVQQMMDAQAAYFLARKKGLPDAYLHLNRSKDLEAKVRAELKSEQSAQKALWDTDGADQGEW